MVYTVTWTAMPTGKTFRNVKYNELSEAMKEADANVFGPAPIEIKVTDSDGKQHFHRIAG